MSTLPFITTIIVAGLSSLTTFIAPRIIERIRQYYTRIKQNKFGLSTRVKQLEEQIQTINDILEDRERNQRAKIRKEVNLYLEELKND